jgi:hypothetical protein
MLALALPRGGPLPISFPVVWQRLKQAEEDLKHALREWNKVWREVDAPFLVLLHPQKKEPSLFGPIDKAHSPKFFSGWIFEFEQQNLISTTDLQLRNNFT